jgi:putative addiction module antidote
VLCAARFPGRIIGHGDTAATGDRAIIELKLKRIGNSVGLFLPREVLARLKVGPGDAVYLTESPDGFRLTPYDPASAAQFGAAEKVMKRRRTVLRELAKRKSPGIAEK